MARSKLSDIYHFLVVIYCIGSIDVLGQEVENRTESTPSRTCATGLVKFLNEIQQDIDYVNRTISPERLSRGLNKKLEELEEMYNEHNIGLMESRDLLANSFDNLASSLKLDKVSLVSVIDATNLLESTVTITSSLNHEVASIYEDGTDLKLRLAQLLHSLESSVNQHLDQQIAISAMQYEVHQLSNLNVTEIPAFVESSVAKKASVMILDQIVDGALVKSTYLNASRQNCQIEHLSRECRSYRRSRVSSLLESQFLAGVERTSSSTIELGFENRMLEAVANTNKMLHVISKTLKKSRDIKSSLLSTGGHDETTWSIGELTQVLESSKVNLKNLALRLEESKSHLEQLKHANLELDQRLKYVRRSIEKPRVDRASNVGLI